MPQPPKNSQHRHPQRWLQPFGMVSLLASSYLLTQAAQAFEPFPRRVMQSHLQTGLAPLRQTRVQPLALISESTLNPVLEQDWARQNLFQGRRLLSQNPQVIPAIEAPNFMLTDVQIEGNQVLPLAVVNRIFAHQKNKPLNPIEFQDGIDAINQWYQNHGYVLAQVVSASRVSAQGIVTLDVAEGVISAIEVRFVDENGNTTNEQGEPIQGKTQEYVILREFRIRPGHVFNQGQIERDLIKVFSLGVFDDVTHGLVPGEIDPREVKLIVNITERNTKSVAAGLGRNLDRDIFLTGRYDESNLFGRGQKLAVETQLGLEKTTLTTSLTSPGTVDGAPAAPLDLRGAVNAVVTALNHPRPNQSDIIDRTEKLHRLTQVRNNKPLEALVLNNLANLSSDPVVQLKTYNRALGLARDAGSPALELYFLLRQARSYRDLGEPQQALRNYTQAFEQINKLQKNVKLSSWLGDEFFEVLSDEWNLRNSGDSPSPTEMSQMLNVIRLGILLDITFTYSVLGDYQAGLYIANSSESLNTTNSLMNYIDEIIGDDKKIRSLLGESSDSNSWINDNPFVATLVASILPDARRFSQNLLKNITDVYQGQTLKILFSDFNEPDSKVIQEKRLKDLRVEPRRLANLSFYQILTTVSDDKFIDEFLVGSGTDTLRPVLRQIQPLIPESFDANTQTWKAEGLQDIVNTSKDALIQHFSESGNQQFSNLVNQFSGLTDFLIQDFVSENRFEKDSPEYYQYRVTLAQATLRNWPNQRPMAQEFDWTRGFILKSQGDAHYRLGDYERAVAVYESAIPFLIKAEDFYAREFRYSNPAVKDFVQTLKGNQLFESLIEPLLVAQRLSASLSAADAYLNLSKPENAKARYLSALGLSHKITAGGFVDKQTERSEILYGLARSEAMLGHASGAREAIEQAIAIHEDSFPNESISGGAGVLDVGFTYGYGVPYQGSMSSRFKFEAENPWLAANAGQDFLVERRCATVTQYFECRQKYFDFYISWLLQQHRANPAAGFNVMAFEASEQAKSFSFRRPDSEVSAQDRFAPAQSLRAIQAAIGDDETLVLEYFLGQEASYLWVLSQNGALQVHTLPPRAEIEAQAQVFYDLLTSPTGRVRPQTTAQAGAALSQTILGPVADQLGTQRLVIVADGLLQYLPFAALPNPNPDNLPTASALQGEYGPVLNPLLLDHEVVHLPSASTLVALRRNAPSRPQPTQELAFFANPVFNHKDERVRQVKLFPWSRPFSQAELANIEALYSAIPATERELDRILEANLLPEDKVNTFFGYEASLKAALDSRLGQYRIVHVASHGIFNSYAPERSGIVLSGLREDGVVQAGLLSPTYAFNDMNLAATELIVLSGCRTGLSQGHIGREGMTGLTNGLFDAGAERVVASLWSVRDDATRELMHRFYGLMLDPENPLPPAQALTEAQRSMWNEPRWQTPYNWAAFTLQGVWE